MLKRSSVVAIVLAVVGLVAISEATTLAPSYNDCAREQEANSAENEQTDFFYNASTFVYCEGVYAEANNGAIIAAATIALFFSTVGLWIVTNQSVRISQAIFASVERPYLYVSTDGKLLRDADSGGAYILYTVTNHGRTPARVIGVNMSLGPAKNGEPCHGATQLGDYRLRIKPIVGAGKRRTDIKAWQNEGAAKTDPDDSSIVIVTPGTDLAFFQIQILYAGPFTQDHETLATWYFHGGTKLFTPYQGWDEKYNRIK